MRGSIVGAYRSLAWWVHVPSIPETPIRNQHFCFGSLCYRHLSPALQLLGKKMLLVERTSTNRSSYSRVSEAGCGAIPLRGPIFADRISAVASKAASGRLK